jgi:NCS1 family nucleobase:cation symporter-1
VSRTRKQRREDRFGDPGLVNIELTPVAVDQRILGYERLAPLWAAVAMGPALYAAGSGRLPLLPSMLAVALGALGVGLAGILLVRSAGRYGIGYAVVCRAAFGSRGALLPIALRWLIGVLWLAVWAGAIGRDAIALLLRALRLSLSRVETEMAVWGVAAAFVLLAWVVARGGMSRIVAFATAGLGAGAVLAFGLVVWGGIASEGFGTIGRQAPWRVTDLLGVAGMVVLAMLPAVLSAADWGRFRRGGIAGPPGSARLLDGLVPVVAAPIAVSLAFAGALLTSATQALQMRARVAPIPDALAFGGSGAATLALLFGLALWLAATPLVGLYSPALAASGMMPRRIGYRRGLLITVVAAIVLVPALYVLGDYARSMVSLTYVAGPLLGVLGCDELIVRRGRAVLDELFQHSREHGPIIGLSISALLAVAAGSMLHPAILTRIRPAAERLGGPVARALEIAPPLLAVFGGALIAGACYLLLSLVERTLSRWVREALERRRHRRDSLEEITKTGAQTNPYFTRDEEETNG